MTEIKYLLTDISTSKASLKERKKFHNKKLYEKLKKLKNELK